MNPEPFVFLDIVLEPVPHPFTEDKPVETPFVETQDPPVVTVPTLDGLLGDKLTAFAPTTVGILFRSGLSQQIIKQMFDVGELFPLASNLQRVAEAYDASFSAENKFRKNRYTRQGALDDSIRAAFLVSQLNLRGESRGERHKREILVEGIGAINVTLTQNEYTVDSARLSASRAALLAALIRAGRSGRPEQYIFNPEALDDLPRALEGRYAVLSPLRETVTEAFHNWHQVELLDL